MTSRILIFVALLGLGAIAAGWIYESRLRSDTEEVELIIPDNIDYFLTNLHYRAMTEDGNLDYEFNSRRLEHRPRTDISHIEVPSLQIHRDGARWLVDARQAQFHHRDNLLQLRDQVVMQRLGEQPLQLFAESISFAPDRDLVTADSSIVLQTDNARIEASGAVFDLAAKRYSLTRARAVYQNDKS